MGREEGGGFRMGNTCIPVADSFQYMAKPIQYCKVKKKLNSQKTKIMASGPIISWQIERDKVEAVTDFIFLGSKITADSACSREIKRCVLLGRKAMTNLGSVSKSKDITLPTGSV